MELVSKINTAGDSGWIVDEEEFDLLDDLRLVSPFKRRRIASENLWLNSCSAKVSKKTINRNDEALVKGAAVAPDYEKFWDDMVQFVEADHSGGIVNREEFDFASDLKLTRQCGRRSIASENLWLNSFSNEGSSKAIINSNENNEALVEAVTVDSDYGEFLNYMVQCFDVDNDDNDEWCVANVNDDDEDHVSDVLDAQRMMFLDNLKEDGKSYVLKHALSNGTSVVVKYEEENDLDTGLGMRNLETMKDCHNIDNIKTENFLRSRLEREKIESPRRILRSNLGKKMNGSSRKVLRSNSATEKTKSSKTVLRNNSRWRKTERARKTLKRCSIREDNESLSLKEAVNRKKTESLETLRSNPCGENRKSPSILNDAMKREKTERLRTLRSNPRGENNRSPSIMNDAGKREKMKSLETLRSNPHGENSKSPTILNDPVKREKTECNRTLRNGSRESIGTEKKLRDAHSIDKKSPVVEKNVQMETKSPVSCPENGCSIRRHSLEGTHLAKQRFNHGIKSEFVDESYHIHLNFVKKDDRCLVHAPEGGKKMVHFGDDESDSGVVVLDDPFFTGDDTPFISARSRAHVDEDSEGCTENNKSQFRDGLLEILQKPYDFTEYARLQIDSRPYLRMHDDFAEVIRQARRDRRKMLNLFRGFFYWLQYLHSEGAFMPWLDSQSLGILPPDDY